MLLAAYAVSIPLTFASLYLSHGSESDAAFFVGFLLVLLMVVAAVVVPGVLVRDARSVAASNGSWRPSWVRYLGGAAVAGVLVSLVSATWLASENPGGDAIYGFAAVLWIATVIYLARRLRADGAP